jgi:hypothetical protein
MMSLWTHDIDRGALRPRKKGIDMKNYYADIVQVYKFAGMEDDRYLDFKLTDLDTEDRYPNFAPILTTTIHLNDKEIDGLTAFTDDDICLSGSELTAGEQNSICKYIGEHLPEIINKPSIEDSSWLMQKLYKLSAETESGMCFIENDDDFWDKEKADLVEKEVKKMGLDRIVRFGEDDALITVYSDFSSMFNSDTDQVELKKLRNDIDRLESIHLLNCEHSVLGVCVHFDEDGHEVDENKQLIAKTPASIAEYIMEQPDKDKFIINEDTGAVILSTQGIFVDQCSDHDLLDRLLPVLTPMQKQAYPSVSDNSDIKDDSLEMIADKKDKHKSK